MVEPVSGARFRIATWNLERPRARGFWKNGLRLKQIAELDADVFVITETHDAIDLEPRGYRGVSSPTADWYHRPGEHCVTIWAKGRWELVAVSSALLEPSLTACATLNTPFGPMMVYGTIIPYHLFRGQSKTSKPWIEHRNSIARQCADW